MPIARGMQINIECRLDRNFSSEYTCAVLKDAHDFEMREAFRVSIVWDFSGFIEHLLVPPIDFGESN